MESPCDRLPSYGTNHAAKLDISAPGVDIVTTDMNGECGNVFNKTSSTGTIVLRWDSANLEAEPCESWLYIKGKLYERIDHDLSPSLPDLDGLTPARSLRIKDSTGDTKVLITTQSFVNSVLEPTSPYTVPAGSIILKGRAFIGDNSDRTSSQGK